MNEIKLAFFPTNSYNIYLKKYFLSYPPVNNTISQISGCTKARRGIKYQNVDNQKRPHVSDIYFPDLLFRRAFSTVYFYLDKNANALISNW